MSPLQLLSALNWCAVVFYGFVILLVFAVFQLPPTVALVVVAVCTLLALPHVYLALNIEKGKGRGLQTFLAIPQLLSFPIGTILGAIALYACWFGESAKIFDDPSLAQPSDPGDVELPPMRNGETPVQWAKRISAAGFNEQEIVAGLKREGFDRDEVNAVIGSVKPKKTSSRRAAPAPIEDVPTDPWTRRPPPRRR